MVYFFGSESFLKKTENFFSKSFLGFFLQMTFASGIYDAQSIEFTRELKKLLWQHP